VLASLRRLIFPTWCELCHGATTRGICATCQDQALQVLEPPFCLRCSERLEGVGENVPRCAHCRDQDFAFESVITAYELNESLRTLVHSFKYKRSLYLTDLLGELLSQVLSDQRISGLVPEEWVITDVPLHHSRERWRYFNQARLLSQALSHRTTIPYEPLLQRTIRTPHQARLGKRERARNVRGAFTPLYPHVELPSRNIILVDDVFTTGATVNACAQQLRKAGAQRILVVCLARK